MWKKDQVADPVMPERPEPAPMPVRSTPERVTVSNERATIGRSISIRGEVTGDEDLLIQGRIDGSVNLKQHAVTVGPQGEVKANIAARVVTVEGRVEGDLSADEQVVLRSSAQVTGDIVAPRVLLEDGAYFRGGVEMGEPSERAGRGGARAGAATARESTKADGSGGPETRERAGSTKEVAEVAAPAAR